MTTNDLTREEKDALAVLAKRNRLLVIVVPRGVSTESMKELKRDVDERLDALVKERGPLA